MRYGARKDREQQAIVDALRRIGVVVFVVNHEALPDLLTYCRGTWLPVEVKTTGARRLTPLQQRTQARAPFPIVETVTEALRLFGVAP